MSGKGTFRLVPPDAWAKKRDVRNVVLLLVDLQTASKFGMPRRELRMLARRREKEALLTRLFLITSLPALTDFNTTLFAPMGKEIRVARLYKRRHYQTASPK